MKRASVLILMAVSVFALSSPAAVAAGRRSDARRTMRSVTTVKVEIHDFGFHPKKLQISKGTRVVWVNRDSVDHTVTFANFGSGTLAPDDRYSKTFRRTGTFRYHCTIHTDMTGKVIVG